MIRISMLRFALILSVLPLSLSPCSAATILLSTGGKAGLHRPAHSAPSSAASKPVAPRQMLAGWDDSTAIWTLLTASLMLVGGVTRRQRRPVSVTA